MSKTPRPPKPRLQRIPKSVLALAAPPPVQPSAGFERLKGGEINWKVNGPGTTLTDAVARAAQAAKRCIAECVALEGLERELRQRAQVVRARAAAEATEKEVG